jgi:hypothetical protein
MNHMKPSLVPLCGAILLAVSASAGAATPKEPNATLDHKAFFQP